jgi:hypothetical protein
MKKVLCVMMVSVIAGMAVLLSCGNSGGGVNGPSGINNSVTFTGTYRVSADSIYVAIITPADTARYCNGNSLVVGQINPADTQPESGIPYSISNNTLTFTIPLDTSAGQVALIETFTRSGFGIDVHGTWNATSISYQVLNGTLPDSTKRFLDSLVVAANQSLASGNVSTQYIFSGTQFTEVISSKDMSSSYGWADYFVSSWTNCNYSSGLDTCSYAVTVVKLSSSSVQLHGKTSGETVTITMSGAGDETYTSSDPTHHTGTYYAKPVSCPNSTPDWFTTFLSANAKLVLFKKSAQQVIPKKLPLPKWLKVF